MPHAAPEQHSLIRSILLHLAPGAIFAAILVPAIAALEPRGIDPILVLFGGIGIVLVPLELGYLVAAARRSTGSWSPLAAVDYRNRPSGRKLALLTAGLAVWFLVCLVVSIALLDEWLAEHVFTWMPDELLQFAVVEEGAEEISGSTVVAFLIVAFAFNAVAGPITEELYFRGHLLPRLERLGRGAPILNTVLFGIYHFFSPWRYPAIIVGFLPITWKAWRERSVLVSIAAHMTINAVTVLLIAAAALADR